MFSGEWKLMLRSRLTGMSRDSRAQTMWPSLSRAQTCVMKQSILTFPRSHCSHRSHSDQKDSEQTSESWSFPLHVMMWWCDCHSCFQVPSLMRWRFMLWTRKKKLAARSRSPKMSWLIMLRSFLEKRLMTHDLKESGLCHLFFKCITNRT